MTYPQEIYTAFSFIGLLGAIIPLPWHLEAWNTGTCLFMFWTALGCLNLFINSILWRDNAINSAPIWCDLSTRIVIANFIALPASSLCINRRLYHIASVRSVTISKAEKRRDVIVDLAIGLGLPLIFQVFYYINQGHRFNIYEGLGCWPFVYNTWVSYVLISTPPVLVGIVSGSYAVRSILAFNKSRNQFNEYLSNHSNLTSSRYFRLMCLASTEIIITVPLSIAFIAINVNMGLRPWKSWENVHSNFGRVNVFIDTMWRSNPVMEAQLELPRWLTAVGGFISFGFFGFADEAKHKYRLAINSITKSLGITSFSLTSTRSGSVLSSDPVFKKTGRVRPGAPVHVHKEMYSRESIVSMDVSFKDAGGLLSSEKDDGKSSTFAPTLSYGAMTLNDAGGTLSDVGGTLPDYSENPISTIPISSPSSTLTPPSPVLTRHNSNQNIEISSLRRDSMAPMSLDIAKAHTSDVV